MAVTWRAFPSMTAPADHDATGGGGTPLAADDEFLTVGDVAERLRVHPQTVRSWIAGGELRAIKIGRTVRIRRSDLEEALERASVAPAVRGLASETPQTSSAPGARA